METRHIRVEGDAREVLFEYGVKNIQVDGCITDAPYPHLEKHRAVGTTTRLKQSWFPTLTMEEIEKVFEMVHILLKPGKHFYVFSSGIAVDDHLNILKEANFKINNILVWDKCKIGMGYNYRNQVEFMIFASKGKREKLVKNRSQYFRRSKPPNMPPYAKPWLLYRDLLVSFARPGDEILDPFAGTDPLSRAARDLGMHSLSIDLKFPPEAHPIPLV
jgi:site-specific DNA-methyltransferase (adenine-specific)